MKKFKKTNNGDVAVRIEEVKIIEKTQLLDYGENGEGFYEYGIVFRISDDLCCRKDFSSEEERDLFFDKLTEEW